MSSLFLSARSLGATSRFLGRCGILLRYDFATLFESASRCVGAFSNLVVRLIVGDIWTESTIEDKKFGLFIEFEDDFVVVFLAFLDDKLASLVESNFEWLHSGGDGNKLTCVADIGTETPNSHSNFGILKLAESARHLEELERLFESD